jgi:hypothetical protein
MPKVPFSENNHVVKAFPPDRAGSAKALFFLR